MTKKTFFFSKTLQNPSKKILLTLVILFIFRFGNTIPLSGIDQEALKKFFLQLENKNSIMQVLNMYSGSGGTTLLSPFSLGIIPFINASIFIDLAIPLFPSLEKLQSEEGEAGRQKLMLYKKLFTLFFSIVQACFLIFYLQSYFYTPTLSTFISLGMELVTGAMSIVWLSNLIDTKGVGNGTSIIIFSNIVSTFLNKTILAPIQPFHLSSFFEVFFILFFVGLICISQTARMNIEVISARQLVFLEKKEEKQIKHSGNQPFDLKEKGLIIRLNQAGIFPIIIASNLIPFFSFLNPLGETKFIINFLYYFLIIGFNYFYTIVFWDPQKISEELRKASVSVANVTPGKDTVLYLENAVKSTSLIGGVFLCAILYLYDSGKQLVESPLINQISISSLIILVGVAFDLQKTIRSMYKDSLSTTIV